MKSLATAAVLCVPLALASCNDSAGPLDRMRMPAAIGLGATDVELGDGDTVQVTVEILDQHDEAFSPRPEGLAIDWSSDDVDVARIEAGDRLIGVAPGVTIVRARLGELEAAATVTVHPVAREVVVIDGPGQDGRPSAPLPDSIVLRVVDRHGDAVGGVDVHFAVSTGGGSVSPSSAMSDDDGLVRVAWTLGSVFGPQTMQASLAGVAEPLTIETTFSRVIRARVDAAGSATAGGTLPVTVRIDSDLFPAPVGGAHVVVSWDPSKLALSAPVGAGDYGGVRSRVDAANGELHLIALDPAVARGTRAAAFLTFDVNGDSGSSTAISISIVQLVGIDYADVTAAGFAEPHTVHID